jgi:hypothetical protein
MMEIIVAIFAVLVGLADWWTTNRVIGQGGSELNPVMRLAMKLGRWWVVPKMAIHLGIAWAVVTMDHSWVTGAAALAMAANALVVVNNYRQIRPNGPT